VIGQVYCDAYIWLLKVDTVVNRYRNEQHLMACGVRKLNEAMARTTIAMEEMDDALKFYWERKWIAE